MQKLKLKIAVVLAVFAIGTGGGLYVANHHTIGQVKHAATVQSAAPTAGLTSSSDKKTVSYEGQTGKTALEILKSAAKVQTQSSSYGEFVTTINGVQADGTKQFWSFYVDCKMASEGASTYKTTNGQKIEWRV